MAQGGRRQAEDGQDNSQQLNGPNVRHVGDDILVAVAVPGRAPRALSGDNPELLLKNASSGTGGAAWTTAVAPLPYLSTVGVLAKTSLDVSAKAMRCQ